MSIKIKQISSLCKISANDTSALEYASIYSGATSMRGQRVSYQIVLSCSHNDYADMRCESDLGDAVKLYCAKDVIVDAPSCQRVVDENYLLKDKGLLPDVLVPLSEQGNTVYLTAKNTVLWIKIDVPENATVGKHKIKLFVGTQKYNQYIAAPYTDEASVEFTLDVIDAALPEQRLIYTRWFYIDCIANAHNVQIFSEAHWELIEKYIAAAVDVGINMLLVPVHTPPLDTAIGTRRPCVQLVDIEKVGDAYKFNFDRFHRYISICKRCGIKYYEITHMFSQWGAEWAPNIMVTENGVTDYMFGWHVKADSEEYTEFLKQYVAAIFCELEAEGIAENTYFHISDEPSIDNMERYQAAYNIFKPLIGSSKIFDALSSIEYYEKGLVTCPVTSIDHVKKFLEYNIEDQWVYYCCGPERVYPNSFIALPSARVRIIGLLCYKYNIKGFLHWGFNFYNSVLSRYPINPYVTTSAEGNLPSGDCFIVYPAQDSVYPSIRGEVTYAAFQDMRMCEALEARIGREAVIRLIDETAGRSLDFGDYPCDNEFYDKLTEKITELLK